MNIEIRNGRVIDPQANIDRNTTLYIADGRIAALGEAPVGFVAGQSIDAAGCVVCPGLIDLGARLNSIEAELAAAVAGGVTSVVVPPDALTLGLNGERLAELAGLKKAGCVAFSQANKPVVDTEALLRAMEYAATFGFAVWLQPQDYWLSRNGIAHEGEVASRLGLAGIPVAAETIAIATIVQLVRDTGCRVHLTRLSSAAGVALLKAARAEGLPVTADVGVHHLLLTENDIGFFNPHARFCPPLRAQGDRQALSDAAASGLLALCSDHTPVGADDKLLPFGEAKPGATGLEVLLPLTLKWAEAAKLSLSQALARITSAPAEVLGLAGGNLAVGAAADVCIFDPQVTWQLTPETLKSRGKNSPWQGYMMTGKVRTTLVGGKVVFGG